MKSAALTHAEALAALNALRSNVVGSQSAMSEQRNEKIAASTRCEANVWVRPGYWHKFQCKRKATTEVDRLPLCTQHAKLAKQRGIRYVQ